MKISVISSAYNNERIIAEFCRGVCSQIVESDIKVEFLVCDDGSTDQTSLIIKNIIQNNLKGSCVKFIKNTENKGIPFSLNLLCDLAQGEIIIILDANAVPISNNWLQTIIAPILASECMVVQGNFWKQYRGVNFITNEHEKWRKSAFLSRYCKSDGTLSTINTRNVAISRPVLKSVYKKCGYIFKPDAVCGADTELGTVINQLGYSIHLNSNATVGHADPITLSLLLQQKIRHGFYDGLIGVPYPNSFYHVVWRPLIENDVSLFFSIPCTVVFKIANITGLILFKVRLALKKLT